MDAERSATFSVLIVGVFVPAGHVNLHDPAQLSAIQSSRVRHVQSCLAQAPQRRSSDHHMAGGGADGEGGNVRLHVVREVQKSPYAVEKSAQVVASLGQMAEMLSCAQFSASYEK
jgi:hypothetical protein